MCPNRKWFEFDNYGLRVIILLKIKGAFGCGKFSSFSRKNSNENENFEKAFGSFGFQKFSRKMEIFCFLTSMLIRKLILSKGL